jgi:hypothetical protein
MRPDQVSALADFLLFQLDEKERSHIVHHLLFLLLQSEVNNEQIVISLMDKLPATFRDLINNITE